MFYTQLTKRLLDAPSPRFIVAIFIKSGCWSRFGPFLNIEVTCLQLPAYCTALISDTQPILFLSVPTTRFTRSKITFPFPKSKYIYITTPNKSFIKSQHYWNLEVVVLNHHARTLSICFRIIVSRHKPANLITSTPCFKVKLEV